MDCLARVLLLPRRLFFLIYLPPLGLARSLLARLIFRLRLLVSSRSLVLPCILDLRLLVVLVLQYHPVLARLLLLRHLVFLADPALLPRCLVTVSPWLATRPL